MINVANFVLEEIRLKNQSNNVKTLMSAIRTFAKSCDSVTDVVRFHTGNGDSVQVLWEMVGEKLNATQEELNDMSFIVIPKVNTSKSMFTETLPIYTSNVDRAALVKAVQEAGLTVINPDRDNGVAVMVSVGVSWCDLENTPEYKERLAHKLAA